MIQLRREAIRLLSKTFPTTLEEWDEISTYNGRFDEFSWDLLPEWINLANDPNLQFFRPAILFRTWMVTAETYPGKGYPGAHSLKLDEYTARTIDEAGDELKTFFLMSLHKWTNSDESLGCSTEYECRSIRGNVWRSFMNGGYHTMFPPAEHFSAPTRGRLFEPMCFHCTAEHEYEYLQARRELWESLPSRFGCRDWESLRKDLHHGEHPRPRRIDVA